MTKRRRARAPGSTSIAEREEPIDGVGLVRQAGAFEAATGVPHGPAAIVVAIVAALLIRPVSRAIRAFLRG